MLDTVLHTQEEPMTSQETTLEEIHERLIKLEGQNRRLKQMGAVALIVAASLLVMGQALPTKTVEANEFILKDTSGNVRARLAVDEKKSAAVFALFDNEGRHSMEVESGSFGTGATMRLSDEQGKTRVYLSANDILGGVLSLLNKGGAPGTVLYTNRAKFDTVTAKTVTTPALFLNRNHDPHSPADLERSAGLLFVGEDNTVTLGLLDEDGKKSHFLGPKHLSFIGSETTPETITTFSRDGVYVTDNQGFAAQIGAAELINPRTGETRKTSAASIVLFDKNKNVLWKAP